MRPFSLFVALSVLFAAESGASAATTYVFSSFEGDNAAGMKLSIYKSSDALSFTLFSATGFGGNTTYLRDPSIMRHVDGKYYVAYTDPNAASCCNPEDHFGIGVSSDLIHWTDLTTVKAGVPSVAHVWAPEWFIDGGVVKIIANIDTGHSDFQPYVFTAQNDGLTSWTGPTALGIGADYIDTFVAKLGPTYHAFVKSEITRFLEHATAASLTGPWTFKGKGDWAGWGNGLEGPSIVQLDDGRYRMYVDPQQGGAPYQYMTSSDLNTWSAKSALSGPTATVLRHGTIIRDELRTAVDGGVGGRNDSGIANFDASAASQADAAIESDAPATRDKQDAFAETGPPADMGAGTPDVPATDPVGQGVSDAHVDSGHPEGGSGVTAIQPDSSGPSRDTVANGCSCRLVGAASTLKARHPWAVGLMLLGLMRSRRRLTPRKKRHHVARW